MGGDGLPSPRPRRMGDDGRARGPRRAGHTAGLGLDPRPHRAEDVSLLLLRVRGWCIGDHGRGHDGLGLVLREQQQLLAGQ